MILQGVPIHSSWKIMTRIKVDRCFSITTQISLKKFRMKNGKSKRFPTIWGTYMKLVTKYQISVINSCWEKCDEKCAYMFNVYKNQLSRQTGSPRSPKGEGGILFYLCPSVQDIFRRIFLSNCWWQKSDIWSQASYRYTILAKPEIVVPGSGIQYFIFEISGKPSFVETVLWRVTVFLPSLLSISTKS
jgi:hypothetical protein